MLNAEDHYGVDCYAECHILIVTPRVSILSIIMVHVVMLSVIMLSGIYGGVTFFCYA